MGGGFPQAEGLHGGLETIAGGCMMGSISAGEEGGLEIGGTEQNKSVSREISRTTSGDGSYGLNIVRWCHHPRNYWFRSPSRYHGRRVRRQDHHVWPMPARPRGPARASHAQQIQVRSPPPITRTTLGSWGPEEALSCPTRGMPPPPQSGVGYTMPRAGNVSCETTVSAKFTLPASLLHALQSH